MTECPTCSGTGKDERDRECPKCLGEGRVGYWRATLEWDE